MPRLGGVDCGAGDLHAAVSDDGIAKQEVAGSNQREWPIES